MPLYEDNPFDNCVTPVERTEANVQLKTDEEIAAQLKADIAHFERGNQILIDNLEMGADRPISKSFATNIALTPINWVGLEYLALRQKGYDVSFSSAAYSISGQRIHRSGSVFIGNRSLTIPNHYTLKEKDAARSVQELGSLMALMVRLGDGMIHAYHLALTENEFKNPAFSELRDLPDRERLLQQGFLTSHIIRQISRSLPGIPSINANNEAMYIALTARRVKPLRPEQMMGIATAAVTKWIRLNPDYPEPTNPPARPY